MTGRLVPCGSATGAPAGPRAPHPLRRWRRSPAPSSGLLAAIAPLLPTDLPSGGWAAHPAALDAAFHAGAVGVGEADGPFATTPRVPTALAAFAAPDHHLLAAAVPGGSGGGDAAMHAAVAAFAGEADRDPPTSTHALVGGVAGLACAAGLLTAPLGAVAEPALPPPAPPAPHPTVEWSVEWRVVEPAGGVGAERRTLPPALPPTSAAAAVLAAARARPAFILRTRGTGPAAQAAAALLRVAAAEDGGGGGRGWGVAHADPRGPAGRPSTTAGTGAWAQLTPARHRHRHRTPLPRHRATYIITGGLGALGSLAAASLAGEGAGVVLLGRSGAAGAGPLLAALSAHAPAVAVACDTGTRADVRGVLASLHMPLTGVLLAGGVLEDAVLGRTTPAALRAAAAPKAAAAAAWAGAATATPLASFLAFSSTAAVLGPPGQAAYAAANGALQGWAEAEAEAGRPVAAAQWGAWRAGMAGARTLARLERAGMGALEPVAGLKVLSGLVRGLEAGSIAGGAPLVAAFAWGRLLERRVEGGGGGRRQPAAALCGHRAAGWAGRDAARRTSHPLHPYRPG